MANFDTSKFPYINDSFDTIVFDVEKMETDGETQFNVILNFFTTFNSKPISGMIYRTGILVNSIEQAYFYVQQLVNMNLFSQKISSVGLMIDLDSNTKQKIDWNNIKKMMLMTTDLEEDKDVTIH